MLAYTQTNDQIVLVVDGQTKVVRKSDANFQALRAALFQEDWDAAREALTVAGALEQYLKVSFFSVKDGQVVRTSTGEPLSQALQERVQRMASEGKDPLPLIRFHERLDKNPSMRSVEQLHGFLQHLNIPLEENGTFLAYKTVRKDLMDIHSGTIHNKPGAVIKMPRNQISDDPRAACKEGLHVGALAYAQWFLSEGGDDPQIIIVRVDPENVVCVPYDHEHKKMRVCEYEVVGYHTAPLPSTVITKEELEVEEEIEEDEDLYDEGEEEFLDECADARAGGYQPVEESEGIIAGRSRTPEELEAVAQHVKKSKFLNTRRLAKLTSRQLLDESLDTLRLYAGKLKIVGASKVPGGKSALISRILRARRR